MQAKSFNQNLVAIPIHHQARRFETKTTGMQAKSFKRNLVEIEAQMIGNGWVARLYKIACVHVEISVSKSLLGPKGDPTLPGEEI